MRFIDAASPYHQKLEAPQKPSHRCAIRDLGRAEPTVNLRHPARAAGSPSSDARNFRMAVPSCEVLGRPFAVIWGTEQRSAVRRIWGGTLTTQPQLIQRRRLRAQVFGLGADRRAQGIQAPQCREALELGGR